jgi:two-component system sensor histidine kinase RpfC
MENKQPHPQRLGDIVNPKTLAPGDYDQSMVRLALVGVAILVGLYFAFGPPQQGGYRSPALIVALGYFALSVALHLWSIRLRDVTRHHRERLVKHVFMTFCDAAAISAFMIAAGENGAILYPIYLFNIVGNGIRYGTGFLYLSTAQCLLGFSLVVATVPYWREHVSLTVGLFVALLIIPLYVVRLLRTLNLTLLDLRRSHAARARFIANMSHELRTPLHTILSLTDVLHERAQERHDKQDDIDAFRMISTSAEHLLSLVNQVLDVAKHDSGKTKYERLPFDLFETLQQASDIVHAQATNKGLKFGIHVEPETPYALLGSAEFLSQVLVNLLGNAVKFTEDGRVDLTVSCESVTAQSTRLVFEVEDSGIGMPPDVIDKIFEPFSQADESISRRFGGTGLGLTIARQLTEVMGGSIECTSVEGLGTHFTVRLPFTRNVEAAPLVRLPTPALFVSSRELGEAERGAFEAQGWQLTACGLEDVSALVAAARDHAPRVLLLDRDAFGSKTEAFAASLQSQLAVRVHMVLIHAAERAPLSKEFLCQLGSQHDPEALANVAHLISALTVSSADVRLQEIASRVCTILVVDDNPTNQRTARMVLESAGHSVTVAADGEAALDALESGVYDIAFMDMHMPNMSGIEAAKLYQIIRPGERTPIVMLTADVTHEAKREAEAAHASGFLTKPIRAKALLGAVERYARRRAPAPAEAPRPAPRKPAEVSDKVIPLADALVDPTAVRELLALGTAPEEVSQLIEEFIADTRSHIRQVEELYELERWSAARDLAHGMKGAGAIIGAVAISKRAAQLERGAPDDLAQNGRKYVTELRSIVDRTQTALRELLSSSTAAAANTRTSFPRSS